jgi:glycosyltransferase involved in cell wall biosynthesis
LAHLGWENPVVLPDDGNVAAERLAAAGVEVHTMPLGRLRATADLDVQLRFATGLRGDIRRLRGLIRAHRADVVVLHGIVNPQAAFAAHLERIPTVWQVLDTRTPEPLVRTVVPVMRRTAGAIMSTGRAVAEAHGLQPDRDRVIEYFPPVDIQVFTSDQARRNDARAILGLAPEAPVIGTLGNLNPQKGHEYFIDAAAQLHAMAPDVRFVILGAPFDTHRDYERRLRDRIAQQGLSESFLIRDPGDRVVDLLPALDIYVLSSVRRSEGIPTAMLEALSCGIPVVASAVGAVPETLTDTGAGELVAPEASDELFRVLSSLLKDPAALGAMAARARELACARFSSEACAATHQQAFELAMRRT